MTWQVLVRARAQKRLKHFPAKERARIKAALREIGADPFTGDIEQMTGTDHVWRRRVGSYRIFYELFAVKRVIFVFRVERRTSQTY